MLDTNIVAELIRNPAGPAALRARAASDAVCVSVVVAAELRYGCAKKGSSRLLRRVEEFLSEVPVLPFDVPADADAGPAVAEGGDWSERVAALTRRRETRLRIMSLALAAARREVLVARAEPGIDPTAADRVLQRLDIRSLSLPPG